MLGLEISLKICMNETRNEGLDNHALQTQPPPPPPSSTFWHITWLLDALGAYSFSLSFLLKGGGVILWVFLWRALADLQGFPAVSTFELLCFCLHFDKSSPVVGISSVFLTSATNGPMGALDVLPPRSWDLSIYIFKGKITGWHKPLKDNTRGIPRVIFDWRVGEHFDWKNEIR